MLSNTKKNNIYIIAEIGINHFGSKDIAIELIKSASVSNVDAIKFQYRNLTNAYSSTAQEIGDEMLRDEIISNYLEPSEIINLKNLAKDNNLDVGISFFDLEDLKDFSEQIYEFDFFKIPSAELNNYPLHDALIETGKHIYISTGCHYESEINDAFKRLPEHGWTPLHCTSNYPTAIQNTRLGYINHLKEKWSRGVGYSSHDENWEICLFAMSMGVTVIERHITLDKSADGLDHTTSSTPNEFKKLSKFASHMKSINSGDSVRVPNQGELLNRQNLGRSYYLKNNITKGSKIKLEDLEYRSPHIGLGSREIHDYLGKPLVLDCVAGTVLSKSLFNDKVIKLEEKVLEFSRANKIALPIRLHDYQAFVSQFPIQAYEFHFSYKEVLTDIDTTLFSNSNAYSIHLPDYINPTKLMDPFSKDVEQNSLSHKIIERTVNIAEKLQDLTGNEVPIVGSFSIVHEDLESFYHEYGELINKVAKRDVLIMLQWLPPIAWYFGGSVKLDVMNNVKDAELIQKYDIPICMDVCHLFMGREYYEFSEVNLIDRLKANTKHIHIADSIGIDGEGIQIGEGNPKNIDVFKKVLNYECLKVIEVWQGHLDRGAGFHGALNNLYELFHE